MSSLMDIEESETNNNIYIPEEWSETMDTIATSGKGAHTPTTTTFICRPKNSGKSTFSRHLLLPRVPVQKDSRHLRDLSIVTYFRQCFPSDMNISSIKEITQALVAHPPYEVYVSAVNIKHLHYKVPKAEIYHSLNGTIVGLAVDYEDSKHLPRCVGLGIVRGIDSLRRVLYIITPVPQNVLEDVDVLLQGFIQITTCLLQVIK